MRTQLSVLFVFGLLAGCTSGAVTTPPSGAPSEAAVAPPSPTATLTTSPTPSPSTTSQGWVERASFPGESLHVLVAGGPGLIAAGCRASTGDWYCAEAIVRVSADGVAWRDAVVQGSSGGSIWTVRRVDETYVALGARYVGNRELRGAVWTSADAERWSLVADFPARAPIEIVEQGARLLAVGTGEPYGSEPYGLFVWTLDDVAHWGPGTQVDVPDDFLAEGVVATAQGFLAFGERGGVIPDVARRAIVGTSTDGLAWRGSPRPSQRWTGQTSSRWSGDPTGTSPSAGRWRRVVRSSRPSGAPWTG